ncbi:hypothetical protein D9M70_490000 [compost metagenome]
MEDCHPQVVHRHQVKAIAHVGLAEHLRFAQIHPGHRVERIGIRRRHAPEVGRRIALDVGELPHRRVFVAHLVDVGPLHAGDFGGDQRIAVDVGVLGNLHEFILLGGRYLAGRAQADGGGQHGS